MGEPSTTDLLHLYEAYRGPTSLPRNSFILGFLAYIAQPSALFCFDYDHRSSFNLKITPCLPYKLDVAETVVRDIAILFRNLRIAGYKTYWGMPDTKLRIVLLPQTTTTKGTSYITV